MSSLPDVTFLYGRARALGSPTAGDPMNTVMIERGCFLGLATSAIEAYNRETNGFVLGNEGTRTIRARPRTITVLRAAYPLQTEDRKPNWVSHGNERAFRRARGAVENLDVGYRVLGGFHSHTGDDGDANLSPTDLDYVADELRRIGRTREPDGAAWLEVVLALRRRTWTRPHDVGWTPRRYKRKLGCTLAITPDQGFDMTIGGFWVHARPDGSPGRWDVTGTEEATLVLPWSV